MAAAVGDAAGGTAQASPKDTRSALLFDYAGLPAARASNSVVDMCHACFHPLHMTTMIQIRNVPDGLHRQLKARAALEGMSMSLFVLRELEQVLARSRRRELVERIGRRPEVTLDPSAADMVREAREERDL